MSKVIFFKPRIELDAKQNLVDFITHCKNNLSLYEDQGGFSVNKWVYLIDGRSYSMTFSKYSEKNDPYSFEPMEEPFLTFAKSIIRYNQSFKEVKSISNHMIVLRLIHDALFEIHGLVDILNVNGLVLERVRELASVRYSGSDLLYRIGQNIESVYSFLREKFIVPRLPDWKNPWRRELSKAERTDKASREWQEERCPSFHQMTAIADCFARAETREDKYWSSVLTLLMFAPSRAGELNFLPVDCLYYGDDGALGVSWFGEKGFEDVIKWVPNVMRDAVIEAHKRLIEIGKPSRIAAKFAYEHPQIFYRHEGCITPPNFGEDEPLTALEFAHAMNFSEKTINLISRSQKTRDVSVRWSVVTNSNWVKKLVEDSPITYRKLAKYIRNEYQGDHWPNMVAVDRPIWDALLLTRDREFHNDFNPTAFSWILPDVNRVNDQLANRSGLKNKIKTIFQRFGIVDEDGGEIQLTSHQLRVWLSTNAERGGMDSWRLAKWAGRAKVEDNRHYDLRTKNEREEQVKSIMQFEEKPTALQAIKLNLPVTYESLGMQRVGIADVTEYGMCVHDYAMSPCLKGGECMTCKEHVCIKGMPKTLDRIKRLEDQLASLLEKAEIDHQKSAFGADRWVTHLGWKLAHVRTIRNVMESDKTAEGESIWISPEHDPSPIKRGLHQRKFKTEHNKDGSTDNATIRNLLGGFDA